MARYCRKFLHLTGLVLLGSAPVWATPKVDLNISLQDSFSDNINKESEDTESSNLTEISPVISVRDKGAKTDYNLRFRHLKTEYSNGDQEDRTENSGFAAINRYELDRNLRLYANSSLVNVDRDTNTFFDDLQTQEKLETISHTAGAAYNTGARQYYQLGSDLSYRNTRTDDSTIDSKIYSGAISFANGSRQKISYWDFDSGYTEEDNLSSNNTRGYHNGIVGFNFTESLSVFAQANREKVVQKGVSDIVNETWGIGLRLNRDRFSSSLAFNRTEEGPNEEFLSASLKWQPSTRTQFDLNYSRRFFGETYSGSVSHGTRKLRQSLTVSDNITSFSQTVGTGGILFCEVGDNFEIDIATCVSSTDAIDFSSNLVAIELEGFNQISDDQILDRTVTYTVTYSKSKSRFLVAAVWNRTKNLSELLGTQDYLVQKTGRMSWTWEFSKKTQFSLQALVKRTKDEDNTTDLTDYAPSLSVTSRINQDVTGVLTYTYGKRESDQRDEEFEENRVSLSLIAKF